MNLHIHEVTEADLPAVLALYAQLGEDDGQVLTVEQAEHIYRRMNAYPDYRIYLAEQNDKPVGTFALLVMDNLGHLGARSAVLEDVVVSNSCRGQGIGKQMMDFANRICLDKGCYKMTFSSNRNREAAHRFYASLGFRQHGISFYIDYPKR
ncbi:MAG: GNAT family N-acetyltransferase [Desulfuromonadales bacterium]|nr:GNAT family N-acetyltransferase [Desulfuromonadales bacterium]